MSKKELKFSKSAVNRAGKILLRYPSPDKEAKSILDNWRACHVSPLKSFQRSLRRKGTQVDNNILVSQRLKRAPSILSKLKRNPQMQLARMQDIGGIRAVVAALPKVRELEEYYAKGTTVFKAVNGGKDYINYPKESGYRSIHIIFKCKNGFSIELQIRTKIQHAWATAVETMGTFLEQSLKSSEGPNKWLKFFSLASSAFSVLESTPRVPGYDHLSDYETFHKLIETEKELNVLDKLSGFRIAANHIKSNKQIGEYHLITLNLDTKMLNIHSYSSKQITEANAEYSIKENQVSEGENLQVVLVTSESIAALKKAYPSYFLDSENFTKQILLIEKKLSKMSP